MTLFELINARDALVTLSNKHLRNFKVSLGVSALVRKANDEFEAYNKELSKIINTYAEHDENGNVVSNPAGGFKLKDEKAREGFEKEHKSLLSTDISERIGTQKLRISADDFSSEKDYLTPQEMSILTPLIEWVE